MEIESGEKLLVFLSLGLTLEEVQAQMLAATVLGMSWNLRATARRDQPHKYVFEVFTAPYGRGPKDRPVDSE